MAKTEHTHPIDIGFHSGRGIRNRWLRNSFLIVSAILFAVVIILSIVISRYYYNSMRSGLETKVKTVAAALPVTPPVSRSTSGWPSTM